MALFVIRGRHLTTVHEPGANLNDVNPGVYWQLLFIAWGYYRNSHSTRDLALISNWFGFAITIFGVTYSFGLVTGYPDSWILPYFSKSEVIKIGRIRFRLFFIPETILNSSAVHGSTEVEQTFSELWADWKAYLRGTVKRKGSRGRQIKFVNNEVPPEFHDSRVADLVDLDLIKRH